MLTVDTFSLADSWQFQANQFLLEGNYFKAAQLYEQAIEQEPDTRSYYWHLGLLMLLQGQEADAQATWFIALAAAEPDQVAFWTLELVQILDTEANRQAALSATIAWAIRRHIRELDPSNVNNLLKIVQLSLKLETFAIADLTELELIDRLKSDCAIDPVLLFSIVDQLLEVAPLVDELLELVEICLVRVDDPQAWLNVLLPAAIRIAHNRCSNQFAQQLTELYLSIDPKNVEFLAHLAGFYQNSGDYDRGIETAKLRYDLVQTLPEKVFSNHLILRGLLSAGGYWQESVKACQHQEALLTAIIEEKPTDLHSAHTLRLFTSCYYLPYFRDNLQQQRSLQNQIMQICQTIIHGYAAEQVDRYQQANLAKRSQPNKRLKIGYISHCLATHSVGWLARWLIQHHDRDRFELFAYIINYRHGNDPLQEWYISQMDAVRKMGIDCDDHGLALAELIHQDEVDILIDLDSITLDVTCEVMALKPAPVQITWLGWDASGIPGVDYFIADAYVLPDDAQAHYSEKIWRLPQSYIAIDGFEVGVPTLRREELDIPADAVIYLSAQRGYKRHRETTKLQMRILKQVPNSYFLIKGLAAEDSIQKFFYEIAAEEGVSRDRLIFLPTAPSEAIHRANLTIADIVLDTFPYNGATTTLETLWMGIPLVTRVGEQFAARNSYTMMINAGIPEGIAWTDQEYVDWGVRLGTDAALRQDIHCRLMRSRQTAPLWNAKQFTREMEKAYEEMYALYQSKPE